VFSQRHPRTRHYQKLEQGDVFAVRDARFKYIYHSDGPSEFFDLETDPHELENLIDAASPDRDRLAAIAEGYLPLMGRAASGAESEVEDEVLEELRALGYVN
jgi:arylsulfatase A-like enzyme